MKFTPLLAAVDLKAGLGSGLTIVMMIAFIYAAVQIITGIPGLKRGDPEAKMSIVIAIVIAGSLAIVTAAYNAFGLGTALVDLK
jgi:hypothetical protein